MSDETFMCEVHVSRQKIVLPSRQHRAGATLRGRAYTAAVRLCKRRWEGLRTFREAVHAKADVAAKGVRLGIEKIGRFELNQKQRQKIRRRLRKRDGDDCFYCGLEMLTHDMTIEHVLAKKHGGNDKLANLALAHEVCNTKAGNMPIVQKITFREVQHLL